MSLSPGTKLGQYEVVEAIGAGGMGGRTVHATQTQGPIPIDEALPLFRQIAEGLT